MKTKLFLIIYSAVSLLGLMMLLSRENVYVVGAIVLGVLLLGHRELWSLIRHRRMPVIDERVRENLSGAMKTTGIFFFIASIVLLIAGNFDVFKNISTSLIIAGQLVVVGFVYLLSYHYYDRVRPSLGTRAVRVLKVCLIVAGLSLSTAALSIVLHNFFSVWIKAEEGFFMILGLIVCPTALVLSLLAGFGVYLKGLGASFQQGDPS